MIDVLLIQPPIRDFYLTEKRTIPYGLGCIASSLIEKGFSVDIFDALATHKSKIIDWPQEFSYLREFYGAPDISPFALFHHYRHYGYSFEYIGKKAGESNAPIVGISSLFTPYSEMALETARIVKKALPDAKIVLGGHHPSILPEAVLSSETVDFVLRGEGEVSMPMLAESILRKKSLDNIPGLVYRKSDGTIHMSAPAVIDNAVKIPKPATHLFKYAFYRRKKRASAAIVASRGCPMGCSYCSVGNVKFRQRPVEDVISEIGMAVFGNNAGFIDFEDENLSLNKQWFDRLLDSIIMQFKNADIEFRAMNGLFPPSLNIDMIRKMKTAGFKTFNLSVGSLSAKQLEKFNRPDIRKSYNVILDFAEAENIDLVSYFIISAPGQNPFESLNDFIRAAAKPGLIGASVFYPSPGSTDYENCQRQGWLPRKFSLMRSAALPMDHTTSRRDAITLMRIARIINFIKCLQKERRFRNQIDHRSAVGIDLLQRLFRDGIIRGITPDGERFEHQTTPALVKRFINDETIIHIIKNLKIASP